jgi:cytochrome c oxidase accessory protein FixG
MADVARRFGAGQPVKDAPALAEPATEQVVWLYQKQEKIYARAVSGWFAGWRWALVWATQLLFYGLPWLEWNARQAVLFDIASRRFYLFGLVLYPQDFIYLTGLLVVSALSLFLFTAVAGRLWCGYACPQTVYTEIFMAIERWIEGDRPQRMKRDRGGWTLDRLWRAAAKHGAWGAVGLWTGFTFVGYFTPIQTLWAEAMTLGFGPWEWFWVLFYGLATYGNAGFLREQVCKYMCPYARFQSAMFDRDTLIIGYDAERGEPRGSRGRQTDLKAAKLGHCIDCGLCVQVCPTGIDIRRGLQYECIGCAACIDVCNGVMDKMQYPRGLIRYDTLNGMALHQGLTRRLGSVFRPRVLVYSGILLTISAALVVSLWLRPPVRLDVVRDRAALARLVEAGWIENVYRLQLMNTTERSVELSLAARGLPGAELRGGERVTLGPAEARWVPVAVRIPPDAAQQAGAGVHPLWLSVQAQGAAALEEKSTFVVPR